MEKQEFTFGIKRIKELELLIDESISTEGKVFSVSFQMAHNILEEEKLFDMQILCFFISDETKEIPVKIGTSNTFIIPELERYKEANGSYTFPDEILITLVSLSVSHTRALLARSTQGTKFDDYIIPVLNPKLLFEFFFRNNENE